VGEASSLDFAARCRSHKEKISSQMRMEGFVRSPSSRRASFAERGVQAVRRSDCEAPHNTEIGFLKKPPLEI
jgi:hypothetical protein